MHSHIKEQCTPGNEGLNLILLNSFKYSIHAIEIIEFLMLIFQTSTACSDSKKIK